MNDKKKTPIWKRIANNKILMVLSLVVIFALGFAVTYAVRGAMAMKGDVYIDYYKDGTRLKHATYKTDVATFSSVDQPSHQELIDLSGGCLTDENTYTIKPNDGRLSFVAGTNNTFKVTITGNNGHGVIAATPTPVMNNQKCMICFATFYYIWDTRNNEYVLSWADINPSGGSATEGSRKIPLQTTIFPHIINLSRTSDISVISE